MQTSYNATHNIAEYMNKIIQLIVMMNTKFMDVTIYCDPHNYIREVHTTLYIDILVANIIDRLVAKSMEYLMCTTRVY